jgi:hypothetical protein
VQEAVRAHLEYLRVETLATKIEFSPGPDSANMSEADLDGERLSLALVKA